MKARLAYWAAPVGVVVIIAGLMAFSSRAQADPALPDLTAEQLVANVAAAQPPAFSGTVAVTTNVGLPDISSLQSLLGPQVGGLASLLGGTTQVKVAVDPAAGARAEIDSDTSAWVAVANVANKDGWLYVSDSNSATHLIATAPASTGDSSDTPGDATTPLTPAGLADQLITAASPSTTFTVGRNTTVAGRAAYTLTLAPKDSGSLISSVDVTIDADTWMPLGVDIWSTQLAGQAAFSAQFTSISYSTPAASLFDFTAPPGATVDTVNLGQQSDANDQTNSAPAANPSAKVVAGQGWASVVEVTGLPSDLATALADPSQLAGILGGNAGDGNGANHRSVGALSQLLGSVTQQTAQGTVYSTYLGSVLVTPDGTVFAGAVPASSLEAAAGGN